MKNKEELENDLHAIPVFDGLLLNEILSQEDVDEIVKQAIEVIKSHVSL